MTLILIAVGLLTVVLIWYLAHAHHDDEPTAEKVQQTPLRQTTACCGAHEVCEAETLLALTDKVVYYDDEELDRFCGRTPDGYSETETEEYRDILLTLQPHEVAGWMRSLALRKIDPPTAIREEALMMVSEFREGRIQANAQNTK